MQVDCADPVALAGFWARVLGTEVHDRFGDPPHYVSVTPTAPGGPWLSFQRVQEPKAVKNRVHLDITVNDVDEACDRIEALGGRRVPGPAFHEYGFRWHVMTDPEGNEFCVVLERRGAPTGPRIVRSADGPTIELAAVGVRFMVGGADSDGGFALVEHPIPPRHLAAPIHRHSREDEYSYVLEGRMGALLGDEVVFAETGDLAFKPRDQWHTFWNAGDGPCRILEIISPAGFERYFEEIAATPGARPEIGARYGLEVDLERVAQLCDDHGLWFPTV